MPDDFATVLTILRVRWSTNLREPWVQQGPNLRLADV
jgi:hypothetical protein